MNILPKKRWHVRTKENIARVRKDEAEAAEKEKEEERRIKLAEQEARTSLLRNRARESSRTSASNDTGISEELIKKAEADIYTSSGNINFFKEIENGLKMSGTNKDYEKEKKEERESYEKKIGLLTYLGQDSFEASGKEAWYSGKKLLSISDSKEEVGLKSKHKIDPINEIIKHTHLKPKVPPISESMKQVVPVPVLKRKKRHMHIDINELPKRRKKSKKKKCKRSRTESSERNYKIKSLEEDLDGNSKREDSDEKKRNSLSEMREMRLKREAKERIREERLRAGKNPDVEERKESNSMKQKYNSQFNPHIAKQNKPSESLQAGFKYYLQ